MNLYLILPGMDRSLPIFSPDGMNFRWGHTVGDVITAALDYVFPIAGLILFFIIISSGFQLMTSAGNEEANAKAKKSLTNGVVGFAIIFLAFWIYQILQSILGI